MSMLLVNDFYDYLLAPARIVGLIIIMVGIATIFTAKRLTRVIKKQSQVDKGDKTYITILTFSLIIILAGMIICCF